MAPQFSGLLRAMQWPELRSRTKVDGGEVRMGQRVERKKKGEGEEWKVALRSYL